MLIDESLRNRVVAAVTTITLQTDPPIGVTAHDGIVTLTGHVASQDLRTRIETTVLAVSGVRAIVQEITIRNGPEAGPDDDRIAHGVLALIDQRLNLPPRALAVEVRCGWVTVVGHVPSRIEWTAIEDAVRRLPGVVGLTNLTDVVEPARWLSIVGEDGPPAAAHSIDSHGVAHTAVFVWDDGGGQTRCSPLYRETRDFARVAQGHAAEARLNGSEQLAQEYEMKARALADQLEKLRRSGHLGATEPIGGSAFSDAYVAGDPASLHIV